jgi:hypothetical protein
VADFQKALDVVASIEVRAPDLPANCGTCIMQSLAVRDYLLRLGFAAKVKTVMLLARSLEHGKEIYSLGMGIKNHRVADAWNGHLVTVCNNLLIDPTFPVRPAWSWMATCPAVPMIPRDRRPFFTLSRPGENPITRPVIAQINKTEGNYEFAAFWIADKNHGWQKGPASTIAHRQGLVDFMLEEFRKRHTQAPAPDPETSGSGTGPKPER